MIDWNKMTPQEIWTSLRSAPAIVGAWYCLGNNHWIRNTLHGSVAAQIGYDKGEELPWQIWDGNAFSIWSASGILKKNIRFKTSREAKDRVDRALKKEGWLLA
jgi:hypothetical protein